MTTIFDRIQIRLNATGKSRRTASLASGMSPEQISSLLRKPHMSPTIETVRKLAIGLETTPEWLAFGVGPETPHAALESADPALLKRLPNEASRRLPSGTTRQHDTTYIQVATNVLHRYVSGALQNESIPEEQADVYADVVLELIRGRTTAHVVLRLEDGDRTGLEFPALRFGDRS